MLTRLAKIPPVPLNCSRPLLLNKVVFQSTIEATHEPPKDNDNDYHKAKPFQEIPKPNSLPLIGSLLTILKNNGYYQRNTHLYFSKLAQKYGPVFRDKIGPLSYVFVYKPEDVAKVFQAEGKYPARGPTLPWLIYRKQRKKAKGLLLAEGKEWRKFRSVTDKKLLKVKDVSAYSDRINNVITDFFIHLDKKRQDDNIDGEVRDLKDSLYKWSFETINTILYNRKLGTFEDPPNPIAEKFYRSVCSMFDKSNDIISLPPYYKYIKTKRWNDYCKIWDTMFETAEQLVDEEYQNLQQSITEDSRKSFDLRRSEEIEFLPYVLLRSELNKDEIVGNIMDLMIGGVDTSANTMLWTLYILGKHPDIQEKLYQEIRSVLKKGEYPDSLSVQKMPYLRGLLKESERMYPIAIATVRILDKDTVLGGYQVPAKTKIFVGYHMMSFDESFHDEPTKIKPERWIRSSSQHRFNPFSHTAFSFGPRMCVGRRIAELEMQLLLARLICEYRLECRNTSKVELAIRIIGSPDSDIRIRFEKRSG